MFSAEHLGGDTVSYIPFTNSIFPNLILSVADIIHANSHKAKVSFKFQKKLIGGFTGFSPVYKHISKPERKEICTLPFMNVPEALISRC